jgi:hypothetical protein
LRINYTADVSKTQVTGSLKDEMREPEGTMQMQPSFNGICARTHDVDGLVAEIDSMLLELDGK